MKKVFLAIGSALLVLTIGLVAVDGPVRAQESDSDEPVELDLQDAFIPSLAENLGITTEELETAIEQTKLDTVDQMAEIAKERILSGESMIPLPGAGIFDRAFGEFGRLNPLPGGPQVRIIEPGYAFGRGENVDDLAAFLGIETGDLIEALRSGQTIVDIAEENGKSIDELRAYLIEQATEQIDEHLQTGSEEDDTGEGASSSSAAA